MYADKQGFIVTEKYFNSGKTIASYKVYRGEDFKSYEDKSSCDIYRHLVETRELAEKAIKKVTVA